MEKSIRNSWENVEAKKKSYKDYQGEKKTYLFKAEIIFTESGRDRFDIPSFTTICTIRNLQNTFTYRYRNLKNN